MRSARRPNGEHSGKGCSPSGTSNERQVTAEASSKSTPLPRLSLTRSAGPSRAGPYGSPKCSRGSRRSSSRPGEPPRFRLQRASVWRGPAIRDRRGRGRQIIAAQNEPECIFAIAFTLIEGLSSATLTRTLKHVTFDDFLFPGSTMSRVPPSRRKRGPIHPVEWDADLAAFQDIPDVAVLQGLLDGALNPRLGTTQEALAVLNAFAARIRAPIDDVHSHPCICLSRLASPACTIRRGGEPDARYSHVPPCARQTRRASFRYRRPFSSQTR